MKNITSVDPDLLGMTLPTVDSVTGVCNGSFPATTVDHFSLPGEPQVLDIKKVLSIVSCLIQTLLQ